MYPACSDLPTCLCRLHPAHGHPEPCLRCPHGTEGAAWHSVHLLQTQQAVDIGASHWQRELAHHQSWSLSRVHSHSQSADSGTSHCCQKWTRGAARACRRLGRGRGIREACCVLPRLLLAWALSVEPEALLARGILLALPSPAVQPACCKRTMTDVQVRSCGFGS